MEFLEHTNDLKLGKESVADLQGNILNGYRRTKTDVLLIRFWSEDPAQNRVLLRGWLAGPFKPTSATDHETHRIGDEPLRNVLVSASGMKALGASAALKKMDARFVVGARDKDVTSALNDLPDGEWEPEFRKPWDLVLLVAHNGRHAIAQLVADLGLKDGSYASISCNALDATGRALTDPAAPRYEHFGFRDGISNPVFTREARERRSEIMARPLSSVLAPDPLSGTYGSYFVLRKLAQDVKLFRDTLEDHVTELVTRAEHVSDVQFGTGAAGATDTTAHVHLVGNAPPLDYRLAAELAKRSKLDPKDASTRDQIRDFIMRRAVGRDRNGYPYTEWSRPLKERAAEPAPNSKSNAFDYEADLQASVCPMQAHVRKTNPRGLTRDTKEQEHTITRRGIPYGQSGDTEVGLLFLCAQADIARQFEHIQRAWANNAPAGDELTFRPTPGYDNIVAQPPPKRHDQVLYDTIELSATFYNCIKLLGSEYLFAPSLTGLKHLAQ